MKPDKPISICLISPKAYPLLDPSVQAAFGGAEVDLYYLATELAKDPLFRVCLITADYGQPSEQILENVRVLKSLRFDQNFLAGAMKIRSALIRADADLYLIKTFSPGVPLVYTFCRLHKRRFLYRTAHRNDCDGTYRRRHPVRGRIFEYCLKHADGVFAQNHADQELLKSGIGVNSIVIRNGHRIEPPPPQDRDCVLWAGRSAAFKNPERFLKLAEAFPAEKFIMICRRDIKDSNYRQLLQTASGLPNLKFIEEVPFRDIDRYYARAKVFVNTSDAEGFPNTFIQAAKAATPILTWQVNPDQFLTQYQCGLACGGDMNKLIEGLKFLLENKRYRELGQNGWRYVREHHDIAAIAEQYKTILKQLSEA